MKSKGIRFLVIFTVAVLLAIVMWFANAFLGNPVSWVLARIGVNRYVEQTYFHLDLHTERFGYDFKTGGYYAYVCSATSEDTAFHIDMDMLGRVTYDSYDTWVGHKYNTELRIREEYRVLTDGVFQSAYFPYELDIDYGDIEFAGDAEWGEALRDFALPRDILELDREYDVLELGRQAGILCVYVMDETVTVERAAEVMLHIRSIFDDADVPFRMLDFVLRKPRPADGAPWPEDAVYAQILYEDMVPEGMTERVRESNDAIRERYAEMDREKAEEIASED